MSWKSKTGKLAYIITYGLLLFLIVISLWASSWHPTSEIDFLVLILCAYTLLPILPITKFKLGPSGFEGELELLEKEKEAPPTTIETAEEVNQEVARFSENLVDSDTILLRLSIEIEATLRDIAESSGLHRTKVGMRQLTQMLQQQEVLTDKWLLNALHFFQEHRNALVHEGRTGDIEKAIDVGRVVLTKLRQIQKNPSRR